MTKAKDKTRIVYQFKVTLLDIEPPVWRRIQMLDNISLRRLSTTILLAMGWNGSHIRQFEIGGKRYGTPDHESDYKVTDERRVFLKNLDRDHLKHFIFEYDFGDGWRHSVELEEVLEAKKGERFPKCIDGARKCPPEDCGGPHRYEDFLAALKDPNHQEHKTMTEWIGYKFDPEAFYLDFTNSDLRDVKRMEDYWWR